MLTTENAPLFGGASPQGKMTMKKVKLLSNIRVDGEHVERGTIIETDDPSFYAFLIGTGKGEDYADKKPAKAPSKGAK